MKKFISQLIVVCLFCWGTGHVGLAQDYDKLAFTHLTPEDGLSSQFVIAALQDQQGFMWFATVNGLNKFDGYELTIYRHNPDDPHSLCHNRESLDLYRWRRLEPLCAGNARLYSLHFGAGQPSQPAGSRAAFPV